MPQRIPINFGQHWWSQALVALVAVLLLGPTLIAGDFSCQSEQTQSCRVCECRHNDGDWIDAITNPESAIQIRPVYYGEVFRNTRGGITTKGATQYQALLDVPLTLDFEKLGSCLPGKFHLSAWNTHGRGLSADFVGDTQILSNIDSNDNIMRVGIYWWEVPLWQGRGSLRLGKQDINTEFLLMDLASDFIQSSFGLSPSAGLPSYPDPSMAVVVSYDFSESATLKTGIWDGLADGGGWGISGNEIFLVVSELQLHYALRDGELPGAIDIGGGIVTGGLIAPGVSSDFGSGVYFQVEQYLYRENPLDKNDKQGLGVFFSHFPRFPAGDVFPGQIFDAVVGGVTYRGLLRRRDDDSIGFGIAYAELNMGGANEETAFELYYKAQLTPRISITPDVQYIRKPSGLYPDSIVAGMRFIVEL